MYTLAESIRAALQAVSAHKLRSFLTMLGIIIGVTAVIAVVSLIQGFGNSILSELNGLGANSLLVQSFTPRAQRLEGKVAKVTPDDLLAIQHQVTGISGIVPLLPAGGVLRYQGRTTASQVLGTTPDGAAIGGTWPELGRFIVPSDDLSRRPVAVIGMTVIKKLNLPADPLGQFIQISGEWFKIVGVLHPRGQVFGFDQDNNVFIPYGTALSMQGSATIPDILMQIKVNDPRQIDAITARITQVLRRQHHLRSGQDNDFKIQSSSEILSSLTAILKSVTLLVGGIVAISLLVGGIGIMNIMLVSVTERTREIGILKSLGARRSDILLQFLIEAVTLCVFGGIIGLLLGYGIGVMAAHAIPEFRQAYVPWWAVALAFGFSGGVGVIFGIAPAAKAAALDPIEALRYE
ncbi:MAG: ABC transporter permease [Gammaproteobacteria bacterium]